MRKILMIFMQYIYRQSHVSQSTFFNLHNCFSKENFFLKQRPSPSHQQIFRTNVTFDQCYFLYFEYQGLHSIILSYLTTTKKKQKKTQTKEH